MIWLFVGTCDSLSSMQNLFSGSIYATNFLCGVSPVKSIGFVKSLFMSRNLSKLVWPCVHNQDFNGDILLCSWNVSQKTIHAVDIVILTKVFSKMHTIHTMLDSSLLLSLYKRFIALQSLWPHTIMCLMSLMMQPSSSAAGSQLVISSTKYCEWGMTFPAFLTENMNSIKLNTTALMITFQINIPNQYQIIFLYQPTNISPTLVSVNLVGIIRLSMHV